MTFNKITRFNALLSIIFFQFAISIGIFFVIEKLPFLKIKEPWNKLYIRHKKASLIRGFSVFGIEPK